MVLKDIVAAIVGAALLAWSGSAVADEYRAEEFLGLDLSQAVLSPKRLGPATEFAPVSVEARAEDKQVRAKPKVDRKVVVRTSQIVQPRAAKAHGAARTKLTRRHGNPLDAQAMDTRIQVWPCKSGGICNWRRN